MAETMHIRWERRKSPTEGSKAQYQIVAILVEGSLAEKGQKAKALARLASIQERFLSIPISKTRAFHRGLFWAKVDRKIMNLGLTEEVRHALETQIAERVSRPEDDWALWGVTCIPHIDCK